MRITVGALNQLLIESRVSDAKAKFPALSDEIDVLVQNDISSNNKYLMWGAQQLDHGINVEQVVHLINAFHAMRTRVKSKDIYQYTYEDLAAEIEELRATPTKTQLRKRAKNGMDIIYTDDQFIVYRVLNVEAACKYGAGTTWCVARQGNMMYNSYSSRNDHFFFILKHDPKDRQDAKRSLRIAPVNMDTAHSPKLSNHITTSRHNGITFAWDAVEISVPDQSSWITLGDLKGWLENHAAPVLNSIKNAIHSGGLFTPAASAKQEITLVVEKLNAGQLDILDDPGLSDNAFYGGVAHLSVKKPGFKFSDAVLTRIERQINDTFRHYEIALVSGLSENALQALIDNNNVDVQRQVKRNPDLLSDPKYWSRWNVQDILNLRNNTYRPIAEGSFLLGQEHAEIARRLLSQFDFSFSIIGDHDVDVWNAMINKDISSFTYYINQKFTSALELYDFTVATAKFFDTGFSENTTDTNKLAMRVANSSLNVSIPFVVGLSEKVYSGRHQHYENQRKKKALETVFLNLPSEKSLSFFDILTGDLKTQFAASFLQTDREQPIEILKYLYRNPSYKALVTREPAWKDYVLNKNSLAGLTSTSEVNTTYTKLKEAGKLDDAAIEAFIEHPYTSNALRVYLAVKETTNADLIKKVTGLVERPRHLRKLQARLEELEG